MSGEVRTSLPTIQQFRDSVDEFLGSIRVADIHQNNDPIPSVALYIDLEKRKNKNAVPWYAIFPFGTYVASVSPPDAEKDKLLGGGVFFSNAKRNYEMVRVDGFLPPSYNSIEQHSLSNPSSFFFFFFHALGRIYPGFSVEETPEGDAFAIRIVDKISEFSLLADKIGIDPVSGQPTEAIFKKNMEDFQYNIHQDSIKTVFKSSFQSKIKGYPLPIINFDN